MNCNVNVLPATNIKDMAQIKWSQRLHLI